MISYLLACANQHRFEAKFRDSDTYARLRRRRKVECPLCGSASISKVPMAPAITGNAPAPGDGGSPITTATRNLTDVDRMRLALSALKKHVESSATDVGQRFPEEARRMHYGEVEERSIYGEANLEEARQLREEGVPCIPLPWPSRQTN